MRIFPLDDAALAALQECFTPGEAVAKRAHILREGETTQTLFFFKSGIFRAYYTADGAEQTFNFFFGPTFYGDIAALHYAAPTKVNIQALEGGEVWTANIRAIEALGDAHPAILKLFIRFYEIIHSFGLERQHSLYYDSAEARYLKLFELRPKVMQQIPQAYIASYLGIQPESLSRIRSRLAKR